MHKIWHELSSSSVLTDSDQMDYESLRQPEMTTLLIKLNVAATIIVLNQNSMKIGHIVGDVSFNFSKNLRNVKVLFAIIAQTNMLHN